MDKSKSVEVDMNPDADIDRLEALIEDARRGEDNGELPNALTEFVAEFRALRASSRQYAAQRIVNGILAEAGYEAYAKNTGGKTYDGKDMPKWSALPDRTKNAWTAAADSITATFAASVLA